MKTINYTLLLLIFIGSTFDLQAANRYWIASSTANWNSTLNWSTTSGGSGGASVPGSSDIANFNNLGTGSCNLPATAVSINSLIISSGYTGTITQGVNSIVINGPSTFGGGTFVGTGAITIAGAVLFSGTAFTFPATLNMNGNSWTYTSGTLNPTINNSTVIFSNNTTFTGSHTLNNIGFNNVSPWTTTLLLTGTTLTVSGNMSMTGTAGLNFVNGNINLLGNLSITNTGTGGGGSTLLTFNGTANQAITGGVAINEGALPAVMINKSSGTLTLPSMVTMAGTTWTYTTGTVDALTNNSTVAFGNNTTITGTQTLNNISFINTTPWGMTYTLSTGTTVTASGNLTLAGTSTQTFTGGTIDVLGNLNLTNTGTGGSGSTAIEFVGTGNQSIVSALPIYQGALPSVTINKPSGTLTFPSMLTMGGANWVYMAGALDVLTNSSTVVFSNNVSISGSHTLNNVNFSNTTPWGMVFTLATGTTLTAGGDMTMSGISNFTFTGGTIAVVGNLNLTNTATGDGGTTVIAFTGSANQTINSTLAINQNSLPSVNINKPSGTLIFPALLSMAGSNWIYTMGLLDPVTNNSTIVFDGSTTITGTHTLNNIQFDNSTPWGITYALSGGTVLTANGNMAMSGISSLSFNGGTINLLGNLNLTNTSTGDGGSTVIAFISSANQSIVSSLPIDESSIPAVNINKPSGTLIFPTLLTMAGATWTYTTGALDVLTNNSTIVFGGNTTFTGSHTLNNIDFDNATPWGLSYNVSTGTTLTAGGTMTLSGASSLTFNGGTINLLGNLNLTNTSTGDGGSTVFAFTGTGNQAIVSSLPVNQSGLPSVTINKPSGTLTLPVLVTIAGSNWVYTAGTLDVTSAASTVYFVSNTNIVSAGMSFYNIEIYNNTSTVGNTLTVKNNITIISPGVLAPGSRTINLMGNWNDWGTGGFTESTSNVNFGGTALQTITTPGGETFATLTTGNAAGIQLQNNITISKTLSMVQGNIDMNGNSLTLGVNVANPGTMSWISGTVIGTGSITRWFKTGVIATGSQTGLFPTGTNTDYRPFNVSAPTTGPTTGGTLTMSYTDGTSIIPVSFPDGAFTVGIRKNLNWVLSTGNGLAGGTYNLSIAGTNFGSNGAIADLRLTLSGSVVGTAGTNTGTMTNPQVNRTALSLANLTNTFYVGSVNPTFTTLPVSFKSFTATAEHGDIVLNWSTAQETNSDHFTIQRSADGASWEDLQEVAAAGTSVSATAYTVYDRNPLAGISYYRLMLTDRDGGTIYSAIDAVSFSHKTADISIYPNPTVNILNITFSDRNRYEVTLINAIGLRVAANTAENGTRLVWNVSNMKSGVYFVHIVGDDGVSEIREIIIRK